MAITAADVKKLRDATGAGMMDAKKALTEADGDFEKAVEILRVAGQAKTAKRADREASNGLVANKGGALVQLGSETDFVAKNEEFIALADTIVEAVEAAKATDLETAKAVKLPDGSTVDEAIQSLAAKIGEKLELKNVAFFDGKTNVYMHRRSSDLPPQVGVMIEFEGDDEGTAHRTSMQIAVMNPRFLTRDEVPAEEVDKERAIAEEIAKEEGKPEKAIPRIVEGRVNGFFKDIVLLEQVSEVSDTKETVGKMLEKAGLTVSRFVRFEAGA
ncbi:translation elongation factor Ts [Raineyella fluvialis]|uniref:Elongation factor Ts n=1 Tax=Raineyella fluvialis TaxID=2662261 RepID=A0A5Q2FDV1_9ACTN|nr:translation elongation factor Ts [Raineyella fluvialis]QGF24948.1 elongation factor Ts [Raineyella fluvialis]